MRTMNKTSSIAALAMTLTLGLAACGSSDEASTGSSSAPKADASPEAALTDLTGTDTSVKLDTAFVAALGSLMLTPGVTGGAKLDAAGPSVSFPITGGNATYFKPDSGVEPYVQGRIEHFQSGLTLTGGGKVVELSDFVVDPGKSVLTGNVNVDGKNVAKDADLFILDGSTLKPLEVSGGSGILQGTTVKLTKTAADTLNMIFGVTALKESFTVGIATITLKLPAAS